MAPAAAAAKAEKSGLRTTLDNQDFSEDVPQGRGDGDRPRRRVTGSGRTVRSVSPSPRARSGTACRSWSGCDLEAAQQALAPIKLITGQINEQYSETVPQGRVIAFSPKFDTVVKPGSRGQLRGQQGQEADQRPGPDREEYRDANKALRKLGFVVGRTEQYDEKVARGQGDQPDPQQRHAVRQGQGPAGGVEGPAAGRRTERQAEEHRRGAEDPHRRGLHREGGEGAVQ